MGPPRETLVRRERKLTETGEAPKETGGAPKNATEVSNETDGARVRRRRKRVTHRRTRARQSRKVKNTCEVAKETGDAPKNTARY